MIYFCEGKFKNDFGTVFRYLYTHLFQSLSRGISLLGESFLFWSLSRDTSIYGTSFFFGTFVHKVIVSCFSDSFVQKMTQQSDGSCNVTSDSQFSFKIFRKRAFLFLQTHMKKNFMSKEYCIFRSDDQMSFLPDCRYHNILLGNFEELLKKLDTFCFTYQHVDCLYTLCEYRFSGKVIAKSGQVFDNVQRAVDFNQRNKGVDRMPSIAKKRLLRKKFKKPLFSSFQKTKTTQTSGSVFAERIEKVEKD